MPITPQQSKQLQAIAILMMLCLHLFNRDYHGLFQPLLFIGRQPLSFYVSLFSDACVPIFAFVSGYGLYYKYQTQAQSFWKDNLQRLKKLYINYWIILFLFAVVLGFLLGTEGYPGSLQKFFLNLSGLYPSYNGAWWFFTTYVFFVLTARFWFRWLGKVNSYVYFLWLLAIYVVAFYFRIYRPSTSENFLMKYVHTQAALYFCTLFQFMVGAFALRYKWNEKIQNSIPKTVRFKNVIGVGIIIGAMIFHGLIPNFIIAPFTAILFIFTFLQMNLGKAMHKILDFFAVHSTNTWLIHMFIYLTFFSEFIYGFTYVPLIFFALVAVCVACSYVVNFILKKIQKIM